ncbi:unnamed protein product [Tetraodon nigroviridis]|uniref:Voltage-dependent calcium channel gamma-2 subunit n=1 Tax=Tetraodon nigroviridis TaxID=99883 RepID=Q4SAW2_TETNG|nr:unnamed protein product [Tetraodon nigroviridis]
MGVFDRGVQMLLTTVGAFAAFSLMTIAVGTDYWLYSRGVCRTKAMSENETSKKNEEVMTHSGLWRTCCLEGNFKGMCKQIDHFPEDTNYEADPSEYFLRAVRASSIFPILSVILLFMGGLCIAASEFYKSRHNIILSAGIFFVSAGLSNIIGIIVYISANAGDPTKSDSKKNSYSYGWSFYFGALSFIIAEMTGRWMWCHPITSIGLRRVMQGLVHTAGGDPSLRPTGGEGHMTRGAVRTSNIFPILSVILLFMGGLCIAASEFYKSRHNIILSAGIFFVSAGLSNIIGIIVYISANAGDPTKSDSKKNSYSYGWSFYFGALSFIIAEMVGVLAVHMFIDRHRQLRIGARTADYLQSSAITRIPSYRYRYRRRSRSSSRSTDPSHSREASPVGLKGFGALPSTEISMYTLPRDTLKSSGTPTATYNSERDHNFLQVHNCVQKEAKDSSNTANRRTTPV